ncbi:hypothetical protein F2Q69_00010778 [Brassica cretica]|uniref:Phosphomannomutase n=1 Tax=Brassica cretica TaxID=69181 RepID=A0A8S9QQR0_BRACR|nr:hypothetical protein F2Q69_00010778 [Brassica cretica]
MRHYHLPIGKLLPPHSMAAKKPGVIALFDVDGTLTAPRKEATPELLHFIKELRKVVTVGVVGGSDLTKISEQLGKTAVVLVPTRGLALQTARSFLST